MALAIYQQALKGLLHNKLGEYQQAITHYTKAIEIDPNSNNYNNRGVVYNNLREYQKAMPSSRCAPADFSKTIELNPNPIYSYYYRGLAYFYLKEYEKAIPDLTNALKFDPSLTLAKNKLEIAVLLSLLC